MPITYPGDSTKWNDIEAPIDGDPAVGGSVQAGLEDVADRTAKLRYGDMVFGGNKIFSNCTQMGGNTAFTGTKTFTNVSSMGGNTTMGGTKTFDGSVVLDNTGPTSIAFSSARQIVRAVNNWRYDEADWYHNVPALEPHIINSNTSSATVHVILDLPNGTRITEFNAYIKGDGTGGTGAPTGTMRFIRMPFAGTPSTLESNSLPAISEGTWEGATYQWNFPLAGLGQTLDRTQYSYFLSMTISTGAASACRLYSTVVVMDLFGIPEE